MGREELKDSIEQAKELVAAIRKSPEDSNPKKQFKRQDKSFQSPADFGMIRINARYPHTPTPYA